MVQAQGGVGGAENTSDVMSRSNLNDLKVSDGDVMNLTRDDVIF